MPRGVYTRSEEQKKKLRELSMGRKISDAHKQAISTANRGKIPKNLTYLHNLPEEVEERRRINIGKTNSIVLKGYKHTEGAKKNMGISKIGHPTSEETRLKISKANKGQVRPSIRGENHYLWIKDRAQLKTERRKSYDTQHKYWALSVKNRDKWACRIADIKCNGRLEAHHILGWKDHPELRYKINNGITLCHAHHPRKRAEEKRLIPTFMELVSVSK